MEPGNFYFYFLYMQNSKTPIFIYIFKFRICIPCLCFLGIFEWWVSQNQGKVDVFDMSC
uniref:Uncharacterized protein n=1 Tax=Kalanchoe fedtschenkoi TaxID=63787 RepID=A0A7N1A883_KALFE